jgi:hypothetical protein
MRRRYRYTWDDVAWMDCDWMSGWEDGGAFNGYSGEMGTSGTEITAQAEHDKERDVFSVFYLLKEDAKPVRSNIHLERRPQSIGGARVYFRAPCCGKSVRKLAMLAGGVACGRCGSITQPVQRKGRTQRLVHKADMLAGRLGCETWYSSPKERPKGMQRDTFNRLVEQHTAVVRQANAIIQPRLIRAARRGQAAYWGAMLRAGM